jgi:hypothetical protein
MQDVSFDYRYRMYCDPCRMFLLITGTGCIVISPTRELSMQTFGVLKELMKYHHHTYGLIMGGANRQTEAQKLSKGGYRGTTNAETIFQWKVSPGSDFRCIHDHDIHPRADHVGPEWSRGIALLFLKPQC